MIFQMEPNISHLFFFAVFSMWCPFLAHIFTSFPYSLYYEKSRHPHFCECLLSFYRCTTVSVPAASVISHHPIQLSVLLHQLNRRETRNCQSRRHTSSRRCRRHRGHCPCRGCGRHRRHCPNRGCRRRRRDHHIIHGGRRHHAGHIRFHAHKSILLRCRCMSYIVRFSVIAYRRPGAASMRIPVRFFSSA